MQYHNLDLWIEKGRGESYVVEARCLDHGESEDTAAPDRVTLEKDLERLRAGRADADFLTRFGTSLYTFVFDAEKGSLGAHLNRCYEMARLTGAEGVRIRLRIDDPEIASIPWEFLYSPLQEDYFGVSIETPVVRYVELPEPARPLAVRAPLQLLVVIPEGSGLDTAAEKRFMLDALRELRERGRVETHFLDGVVTRERITDALLEHRFDVFHFIGHGDFHDDEAYLVLNGANGEEDYVDHTWIGRLFANHLTMKLVVLNSCKGAEVSAVSPFVGIAPQLVRRDVPAVVAMQYAVADEEALCFARAFYTSLFRGADKGRVDVAISHARNELLKEFPGTGAMGLPVLYMRSAEGVLFSAGDRRRLQNLPFGRHAFDTAKAVARTHEQRIESGRRQNDDAFVAAEERELARIKTRIRLRNASYASAAGVALLMFFGLWMYAFDWLPKHVKPEHYTVALSDVFVEKSLHDDLTVVSIDEETEQDLGKDFDSTWRVEHARLLDRLSTAGARVVAFDLYFDDPSEFDQDFARAIDAAQERGTRVILGVKQWASDYAPDLVASLRGADWGSLCMGLARHAPNVVPLLSISREQYLVPSLSLASTAGYYGAVRYDLDVSNRQISLFNPDNVAMRRIPLAAVDLEGRRPGDCTVIEADDPVAEVIIDYTPLEMLRERRIPYQDIVSADGAERLGSDVDGNVVIVGLELEGLDVFQVWRGFDVERRHGLMLHADAVNALLQGTPTRWLGSVGQFVILLLMAMLGAAVGLQTERRRVRNALLAAAVVVYLAGSIILYVGFHILLNGLYHVLALLVSSWTVEKIKRRSFP